MTVRFWWLKPLYILIIWCDDLPCTIPHVDVDAGEKCVIPDFGGQKMTIF